MKTVRIEPRFAAWREQARALLADGVPPEAVLWEDTRSGNGSLFGESEDAETPRPSSEKPVRIPKAFVPLAELVSCHSSEERWSVLYRVAWRITRGNERGLLEVRTDSEVKRLEDWSSAIRRDRHKMKAFVRFKKVGEIESKEENTREQFVAWFEPEHDIVELTAPFFAKRFAGMDWSILTPWRCAHWDGEKLQFTEAVTRSEAPTDDVLEDYWRSYYAHIFNPARLKLKAMQAEMPVKYWRNLPEAPLIAELTSQASNRAIRMIDSPDSDRAHVSERIPAGVPEPEAPAQDLVPAEVLERADSLRLSELRDLAAGCRACPLHERATRTVFGEGPEDAEILVVGEQPGDSEDLEGRPFVGPAGRLLDDALSEAGIDRADAYVTNVVKHFKWKRQGKRRLHQSPSSGEIHHCRPWVLAEILRVKPRTVICLGATAARALLRSNFALLEERGLVEDCPLAERVIATVHPSYLLRLPAGAERDRQRALWIEDLRLADKVG